MKLKYEFEMEKWDCSKCQFLRGEAFSNKLFCSLNKKLRTEIREAILAQCQLKEVE